MDSSDNLGVGAKLLSKLGGWAGGGLGKHNQGSTEPIKACSQEGNRMGLGKGAEEDRMLEQVTKERRKMDIEREDTEDSLKKKAENAAHLDKIMSDVKKMNEVFFCEVCNKQYKNIAEMTNHLSSMDHHHVKRLKDLKRKSEQGGSVEELEKRRKGEEERLKKDMEERIKKANEVAAVKSNINGSTTSAEPSHSVTTKVSFSMSLKKKK